LLVTSVSTLLKLSYLNDLWQKLGTQKVAFT